MDLIYAADTNGVCDKVDRGALFFFHNVLEMNEVYSDTSLFASICCIIIKRI